MAELNYYYQMNKDENNSHFQGKWICCGGCRDYGTQEEIDNTIKFYLDYFSKNEHGTVNGDNKGNYKVIITKGFFGNVAGREENRVNDEGELYLFKKDIKESDIIVKYNF